MNTKSIIKKVLFIAFILSIAATAGFGQGLFSKLKDKVKSETNTAGAGSYQWARVEVRVSWEEKGDEKHETRVYYSNISLNNSSGDLRQEKNFIDYFDDGIVAPMKARGIELEYYDSDVEIYPLTVPYDSLEEAQKQMNDQLEIDKSNEFAIYTFIWKYNAAATGEGTTQPKRVFSVRPAPASENTKVAANNNAAEREAKQQAEKRENELAQQQKQIWGFTILKVRVKNRAGQEFTRVYVSEIAPVSRDDYNAFYNTDQRIIIPRIWEYFAATVVKAARQRGEEIEEPYDSSIMYQFSLDRDADLKPLFRPKTVLDEPRTREIGYAKDDGRPVFYFRWDPSGKNTAADLQKEMNRGASANLPN